MKKALLIGINYKNTKHELRGCINDTKNIKNILIQHCEYNEKNIVCLTDDEGNTQPTKINIETQIKWLVSDLMPGDTLLFYYSGHGFYTIDKNSDEVDGKDEVLIPSDYENNGVITDDWLFQNLLKPIPSNVTLWAFADCCHSGSILDLKYNFQSQCTLDSSIKKQVSTYNPAEWSDRFVFYIERSHDIVGNVILLTGCQDEETSIDVNWGENSQGAFTYCLIEMIKNNLTQTSNGTPRFKLRSLKLRNVLKELNARLKISGFRTQNTQLSASSPLNMERTFDI